LSHTVAKFAPSPFFRNVWLRPRAETTKTAVATPMLAHDYLLMLRGAERTFAEMAACWPDAPIYTLIYDEKGTRGAFRDRSVTTSPLQGLGATQERFRHLLPLFPSATTTLRPEGASVLVSSSSAFAHAIRPPENVPHVCYCHSPFRYAWHERRLAASEVPGALRPGMNAFMAGVRRWDVAASKRVTHYIANSLITQERIAEFYGRDSVIIHPPVDVDRFSIGEPEDYFLVVTEVVRHKRVQIALEAARRAGKQIKVVGTGPDLERLKQEYAGSATFVGRIGDQELTQLYAGARAMVVPNIEEFGIAAVEGQAAGRPVLAADAGGARETVIEGVTGHRVAVDDVDALAQAMSADFDRFDPHTIRQNAMRFSSQTFRAKLAAEVAAFS
jgi:glycosyltransferase involved in cell wall biosynthesis